MKPKMTYYFVDTNIIISYINEDDIKLIGYINNPDNHFYYTETVRNELNFKNILNEFKYKNIVPDIFKYVDSDISPERMNSIFKDIFDESKTFILTSEQISKFKNDLKIIFEAGYVCYDILPKDVFTEPKLLTHNLKLYNTSKALLETLINNHGFEHLIQVIRPNDIFELSVLSTNQHCTIMP